LTTASCAFLAAQEAFASCHPPPEIHVTWIHFPLNSVHPVGHGTTDASVVVVVVVVAINGVYTRYCS